MLTSVFVQIMASKPPIKPPKNVISSVTTIAIMILATIAISISSYYRDISNYRHYRPALLHNVLHNTCYYVYNIVFITRKFCALRKMMMLLPCFFHNIHLEKWKIKPNICMNTGNKINLKSMKYSSINIKSTGKENNHVMN